MLNPPHRAGEDRSIEPEFGETSGEEASMWQLDPFFPETGRIKRIAQMNLAAVLPDSQTDPVPGDIGNWESSGVLDVSDLFDVDNGTLLIADVQAHSVRDGSIGGSANLVEGGQLFFLYKERRRDHDDRDHDDRDHDDHDRGRGHGGRDDD